MAPNQATAIFRIFQEILTNVARHAQAANVAIRLTQDNNALLLEVSDDGVGIQRRHRQPSLARTSGHERARRYPGRQDRFWPEWPARNHRRGPNPNQRKGRADSMKRILIADDHAIVRKGLTRIFHSPVRI